MKTIEELYEKANEILNEHDKGVMPDSEIMEFIKEFVQTHKQLKETKQLDEKGFVFIGNDGKPYWIALYHGTPWIFYWHIHNKAWVTLRQTNQMEIWQSSPHAMPDDHAQHYHDLNEKFLQSHS